MAAREEWVSSVAKGARVRSRRPDDAPIGDRVIVHGTVAPWGGHRARVLLRREDDPDGRDLLLVEEVELEEDPQP